MTYETWIKNTGVVPEGLTNQTSVKVKYRGFPTNKFYSRMWNDPVYWTLSGCEYEIIEYSIFED